MADRMAAVGDVSWTDLDKGVKNTPRQSAAAPVLLLILVPLDIVASPRVPAHGAAVLVLWHAKQPRFVGVVRPHVAVEVLGLGPAGAADVTLSALRVVVDVFAVGKA
jgi:hypothetical protein